MYELMSLMKLVDDRVTSAIRSGEVIAIYYSHRGQEAIAAALGAALRPTDQLVTTYRGLHDHIAKGGPLVDLLGGVLGKDIGAGRGKSHILSLSHPEVGAMLSTGIVGGGLPIAAGLGLSAQLDGADRVTAVCFGDGASNTGSFHESLNLASLWNLPVVFVCQNNLYGEKTPVLSSMKVMRVADRGTAYDIPGVRVNGNDPDATYGALTEAIEQARSGGGPTLVECMTYRFRGHSLGDTMTYMPAEERAEAEAEDPVPAYRQRLLAAGVCSAAELDDIDAAALAVVTDAVKQVLAAPDPRPEDVMTDLYEDAGNIPALPPVTAVDERAGGADVQERQMTMVQALNLALDQALAADEKVFLLGEDIGLSDGVMGVSKGLARKYGEHRVRDTPISEAAIVGAAIGASLNGYRPVAEIMLMDFLPIAMDQIVNHAAKLRYLTAGRLSVPITIRCSSIAGGGTPATHSQALEAWFMGVPGIKVVIPSSPAEAKGLLTSAIADNDPVLFIETGALYGTRGQVPEDPGFTIPFGQANVVRPGDDITIVTYGRGVRESLAAAGQLAEQGINAEVLDLRTLLPLDVPGIIESVSRTRRALVVHFALKFAGPGAEIAATIEESLFGRLAAPVTRLGARFIPFPSAAPLQPVVFPTASDIADAAIKSMKV